MPISQKDRDPPPPACHKLSDLSKNKRKAAIINHIAEPDKLEEMLEEQFLNPLRRNSVVSISAIKRQFRILSRAMSSISSESFERINAYRTRVYKGDDYKEGINAFLEKRTPEYKGKASDLDTE